YPIVNRSVLTVTPGEPFIDWVVDCSKKYDKPGNRLKQSSIETEGFDSKYIYLIPDFDNNDRYNKFMQKHCPDIFEDILGGWYTIPKFWPEKRNWRVFKKWFRYEINTMVQDLSSNRQLGYY
ncbi:MAG: hypothetical protein ACQEQC_08745, partial [Elusimicrobiota bacterium]